MKFPVVIHHDTESAYGVTVPDIPGCFSAGDTFQLALENAREAIDFHLAGLEEEGMDIPRPSDIDTYLANPDYEGGTWALVDVEITPYLGNTEKINVTLPSSLIRKIDARHKNRSKFLAEAALLALS